MAYSAETDEDSMLDNRIESVMKSPEIIGLQEKRKDRRKNRFKNLDQENCGSQNEFAHNKIHNCDENIAEELEDLLSREIITAEQYDSLKRSNDLSGEVQMSVSKNLSESTKRRHLQTLTSLTDPFPYDSAGIPVNWTGIHTDETGNQIHNVITLDPDCKEYQCICEEIKSAGIEATKIERLENLYLLNRFKNESEDMKKHRDSGFDLNIRYLYHGTKVDKSRICEEGLDQRLSRMGFFGKGIYFSDNPLKCIHYARDHHGIEESYILKCRVILGEPKVFADGAYDISLQREPEKPNVTTGWRFYDSVMGCPQNYKEFVVYENRRAMIEYIISFKLDQRSLESLTPKYYSSDYTADPDDKHTNKIQEIRETIRQKRCAERGEEYRPPDEDRKRQDREVWQRLQQIHKGPQNSEGTKTEVPTTNSQAVKQSIEPSSLPYTVTESGIDPVDEVMDSLVTEFLSVTVTDNIEQAKYYIERSEMDVDRAITLYYEEML